MLIRIRLLISQTETSVISKTTNNKIEVIISLIITITLPIHPQVISAEITKAKSHGDKVNRTTNQVVHFVVNQAILRLIVTQNKTNSDHNKTKTGPKISLPHHANHMLTLHNKWRL